MIYTVTGPIKETEMGPTLSHEHFIWDTEDSYSLYFDRLYDEDKVHIIYQKLRPILLELYSLGCRSIVEASPPYGGQNLLLMQKLSLCSGINVLANTGVPFDINPNNNESQFDVRELANRWIQDYKFGLDTINGIVVRPAQIKLLLGDYSDGRLNAIDQNLLTAAVLASKETGMPIHCHIFKATAALDAIKLLEEAQFDFSRFLWAHAGVESDWDVIEKMFIKGGWLGFDQIRPADYDKYFKLITKAIDRGYKDRILLSQDFDFYEEISLSKNKHSCASFFKDFIRYCDKNGLSEHTIYEMITSNPSKFFSNPNSL